MAASQADGETHILNAACEPEIVDLCNFLELMKIEIKGIGTSHLIVVPNKEQISDVEYQVIPDRIEAGTFMIGALITKGDIIIENINISHLEIVSQKIKEAGGLIDIIDESSIRVYYNGKINSVDIDTKEYPGYPTDLQAQWMALMAVANGNSTIKESIYKDRFTHISELNRFGAQISFDRDKASIKGKKKLVAAPVMSTDIRASASLILAALSAEGTSNISRIYHIDRGYENIELKIKGLKGDIARVAT
jgi:UDP-N-acetylglucosamine 1-carboxyvinyltransferase